MCNPARLSAAALLLTGLAAGPASAAYFGSLSLRPGQTQLINVGAVTRNVRVCNDFDSAGAASVTIAGNPTHHLGPGQCTEDVGDRVVVQSQAGGPIRVDWRALLNEGGHRMFEE